MAERKYQIRQRVWLPVILTILTGCAGSRVLTDWPPTVPPQDYFLQAYAQDSANQQHQSAEEYLTWIVRFYDGWEFMATGWNDITPAVLDGMNGTERSHAEQTSRLLGQRISAEWAKDNSVRRIDTAMLSLWGSVLLAVELPAQRLAAIDLIHRDVGRLLSGDMHSSQISEQRYINELGLPADF